MSNTVRGPVSPLFSYPLGNNTRTESYISENVTWRSFTITCYENMVLQEDCKPQLTWKFSDGRGSKDWITLHDEGAYKRMMKAGAERIRARAKKETDIRDADLGFGWRIDIKPATKVKRIVDEEAEGEEDAAVSVKGKESDKKKKGKKRVSKKVPAKRKRGGKKKVSLSLITIP